MPGGFRGGELGDPHACLFSAISMRATLTSPVDEHPEGELQVVEDAPMEGLELGGPLARELVLVLDLLGGELHQVLVDDVADMLEVDGEGNDLHGAAPVGVVEALRGSPW